MFTTREQTTIAKARATACALRVTVWVCLPGIILPCQSEMSYPMLQNGYPVRAELRKNWTTQNDRRWKLARLIATGT